MPYQEQSPNIGKQLEAIAGEICDHYCKFADQYYADADSEDKYTEKLVMEHCEMCPLVQFLAG